MKKKTNRRGWVRQSIPKNVPRLYAHDWTELLHIFLIGEGVKALRDDEMACYDWIIMFLDKLSAYQTEREAGWAGKDPLLEWQHRQVRRWLKICGGRVNHHTDKSIVRAIAGVKCNHSFYSWLRGNLRTFWT